MARSHGDLWKPFVSWRNLCLAYARCRRRKRFKRGATQFDFDWETNLLAIQGELADGIYQPGKYRNFQILEPKPRIISAAPFADRIVHHAIINIVEPIWERSFIFDSYACRKGKVTHRAIRRGQRFLKTHQHYIKSDIVKFFPNIDHDILLAILKRRVRDKQLLEVISKILNSGRGILEDQASRIYFPGDDLFSVSRPKGLPIGNLTSQFFANVYLDRLDHFVKEELQIKGYVRYADDFVFFGNDKAELREQLSRIREYLQSLRLTLHKDKTVLGRSEQGIKFLGFKVKRNSRRLTQDGIKRYNRNLKRLKHEYRNGRANTDKIKQSLQAWNAHADFGNTKGIRKALQHKLKFKK